MKKNLLALLIFSASLMLHSCYRTVPSKGGGQVSKVSDMRKTAPTDVLLPPGYKIEVVTEKLTFPTAVTFDESGTVYVIEAGYAYGEVFLEPKLFRVDADGSTKVIYSGQKNGPWTGVTFHNGHFYIAEGGQLEGGKILKVDKTGAAQTLVEGLPSFGDHHTNGPVIKDGFVYFSQGTATNSGVVGNDNEAFGWLRRNQAFHDIPCKDITVNAVNYTTSNVLTPDEKDEAVTGPFSPYNTSVQQDQVIRGAVPCNGAVMRVPLNGGKPELVAWGFRNPYGLAVGPDNQIYVSDNSYDERGSRPVWGTGDLLFRLEQDAWYGWPDYNGNVPLTKMEVPGDKDPKKLLAKDPGVPPSPVARLGVHSSSNGMSFSHSSAFGFKGQAFIAQFGDMAPEVGKVMKPVGFKVVRVDVQSGIIEDFAANKGKKNGPATWLKSGGLERPVSVQFSPDGNALYIVDFGILTTDDNGTYPVQKSGVIWKVTKQ